MLANTNNKVYKMSDFDIAVIGGGMVGGAAALGFARQGKRVVLVEGKQPLPFAKEQAMDLRISAISQASVQFLDSLGAWKNIENMRICPYRRLETWEYEECRTRFHADSVNLPQLGYIIENRLIQLGLWQQFGTTENLTVRCPEQLQHIEFAETNTVTLASGDTFTADWIIGADGARSQVRQLARIGITAWDYRQYCMLINVTTEKPQQDITWQRFYPEGPRSFLPLSGQQGSLVWYDTPARIKQLNAMTPAKLKSEIISHFPPELGDIEVLQQGYFPLTRQHAQQYVKNHCILIGDAAHTIHPLAGQGVNLGFKDIATLLHISSDKKLDEALLARYERQRRADNLVMQTGMDLFYKGFRTQLLPVKLLRNAALKLAENSGPIKERVLKYALGLD